MVRLLPHHPLLRRATDALQLGLSPERGLEIAGLSPPLRCLLLELVGSRRVDDLLARAVELGAPRDEALALLSALHAEGALVDGARHDRLDKARRNSRVLISGDGPLLVGVAAGLAAAGMSRLFVAGDGVVGRDEPIGFDRVHVGRPRAEVARDIARANASAGATVRVGTPNQPPDLAILVDLLRPDPDRHPMLPLRNVPLLIAQVCDGIGTVGPLVLPGRSSCPRCMDLHGAAADDNWPVVAAGLTGRIGSASPATTTATAALTVEQALLALDSVTTPGPPPPTLDAVLELDIRHAELRQRPAPPHPDCLCGASHIAHAVR